MSTLIQTAIRKANVPGSILAIFVLGGGSLHLLAQGDAVLGFRQNVVRIAQDSGNGQVGFGFIVADQAGEAYIVTANHVVAPANPTPDTPKAAITIFFYTDQGTARQAEVLEHDTNHDLALIRVQEPAGFQWQKDCLAPSEDLKRDTPVWFIGRDATWYVPAVAGEIDSDGLDGEQRFSVDMPQLRIGSSGGPVITAGGLIGMIELKDAVDDSALSMSYIKMAVTGWGYPWNLTIHTISLAGDWNGDLTFDTRIVFHIGPNGSGTTDSPDQNFFNVPSSNTTQGNSLNIVVPVAGIQFSGPVNNNSIVGTFSQGGVNIPLTVTRNNSSSQQSAGSVEGDWSGKLPPTTLPLVLHLNASGGGTCDSTAQPGANGMGLQYSIQGADVHFQIPSVGASFSGTISGNKLTGNFLQNNRSVPIVFSKTQ